MYNTSWHPSKFAILDMKEVHLLYFWKKNKQLPTVLNISLASAITKKSNDLANNWQIV